MHYINKLDTPGEHPLILQGKAGTLEAVLTVPAQIDSDYIAILGHPHSLQGGTMNNKVVTTMARVFKELNIGSLRFNFRGVGQSEGAYDEGIGESEDMIAIAREWQRQRPSAHFIFAGFSFGSYVAYRSAASFEGSLLITIAPPVHHYDYTELQPILQSWLIVQGNADEVVPADLVLDFAKNRQLPVLEFPDTGHFFHGKLLDLKAQLLDYVQTKVQSS
ncbi:MAG: alpha/beta hydrolase [Legionellales bacterium]